MPQDKVTAGYQMHVDITFTEVNKFGDKLSEGKVAVTKTIPVKNLTELATVLARVDEL